MLSTKSYILLVLSRYHHRMNRTVPVFCWTGHLKIDCGLCKEGIYINVQCTVNY